MGGWVNWIDGGGTNSNVCGGGGGRAVVGSPQLFHGSEENLFCSLKLHNTF